MPIRMLLEELCRPQDLVLAKRVADKLEAHRQSVGKTAGDAGRGQAARVSKAAERIGKGQLVVEVGGDLAGRHRQRGRGYNVEISKELLHFFLGNAADAVSTDNIGAADLLIHIPANAAFRIGKLRDFSRFNE